MRWRWVFIPVFLPVLGAEAVRAGQDGVPAPWPQFTFKRVGLPRDGAARINVQIDPAEQAAALARGAGAGGADGAVAPDDGRAAAGAGEAGHAGDAGAAGEDAPAGWFWGEVAADMERAGPANLARALEALGRAPAGLAPRLQELQDIAVAHGAEILRATVGTDISPALVVAMIAVESGGRADALSEKGARGLMQLSPQTAARFAVSDPGDPGQNIHGGVAYMAWPMETFSRDPILALAGYNAGENAVRESGGVPPFAETRAYVPKVLAAWQVARGLCLTPPELITDGCVFAAGGVRGDG